MFCARLRKNPRFGSPFPAQSPKLVLERLCHATRNPREGRNTSFHFCGGVLARCVGIIHGALIGIPQKMARWKYSSLIPRAPTDSGLGLICETTTSRNW